MTYEEACEFNGNLPMYEHEDCHITRRWAQILVAVSENKELRETLLRLYHTKPVANIAETLLTALQSHLEDNRPAKVLELEETVKGLREEIEDLEDENGRLYTEIEELEDELSEVQHP
jgi:predicted RNase H-like nuclease (RuvC/YqgF family)